MENSKHGSVSMQEKPDFRKSQGAKTPSKVKRMQIVLDALAVGSIIYPGVTKGYTQTYDIDYGETFSPVAGIRDIRILLAMAAFCDYEIWQIDVKTASLNGHLSKDIYVVRPGGFVDSKHPNKVYKLQRSIYGLKQASRSWNKRFDEEIKKIGFTKNYNEPCVYLKASRRNIAFLVLCVDEIIIIGDNITILQDVKS
nr:retrotransposon protein, putative, Ty1-copia subclass [Tanacetum cinerariifolium]